MDALKSWQAKTAILWRHFKFYLSREISYPLVEADMLQLCFLFRCNLSCKMCNMRERAEIVKRLGLSYELSFELIKDLIVQAADMGIKQLFLVGGEPFLREDLFDIIKFAYNYNIKTLVSSNGTLLDNTEIIKKILDSKLYALTISIDGACENTYKNIRGMGLFEKIKNNIQLLNRAKKEKSASLPSITLFCTIMNQNIEELVDIANLTKNLEVDGIGFQPVVADNTDQRIRNNSDSNWVPVSRHNILDQSIDRLVEYKLSSRENFKFILSNFHQLRLIKKYFRGTLHRQKCYMGFNRIIISQDGKMYFCAKEPDEGKISFGDVHKDKLRNLWYSRQARIFRRSIKKCSRPCLLGCTRRNDFDRFMDDLY